ncbi:MAG: glycosyltransferase family 2 protein [Alistipes sp.]|nr:glycosyltransferase family 2 protein [Alistipes sp.]
MNTAVVILNWNGVKHLQHYLPRVVETTHGADIVVADNGSTDDSVAWLKATMPAVKLILLDKNYGFAEGYNRALAQLDGYDIFVLLNSDIEPAEGWLSPLLEQLEQNEDVAVVVPKLLDDKCRTKFEYAGASGGFIDLLGYPFCRGRILNSIEEDKGQYDTPRDVMWGSGAAFCCRAEVYRELGGLAKEFFAHQEEIDLCWRVWLSGRRVVIEPRSKVYHLGGATLSTDSPFKTMLNHRNNLAMLFRCASPWQRALVAVVRPVLDFAAAMSYLVHGKNASAKAVWQAWHDFMAWHKRLSAERKEIRKNVKREAPIYYGSVVLRYMFGKREFNDMM